MNILRLESKMIKMNMMMTMKIIIRLFSSQSWEIKAMVAWKRIYNVTKSICFFDYKRNHSDCGTGKILRPLPTLLAK